VLDIRAVKSGRELGFRYASQRRSGADDAKTKKKIEEIFEEYALPTIEPGLTRNPEKK
jgi:hypothetical protein